MEEPPRSIKERLFTRKVLLRSVFIGVIIAIGAMIGCINAWTAGGWNFGMALTSTSAFYTNGVYAKGVTMTFAGIVVAQAGNVLACRTTKQSIFKTSIKTNKWIIFGIASQLSILAFLIYVPLMNIYFTTAPLNATDWVFLLSLAIVVVFAEEIRKFFSRRFSKTSSA
jgi:sodium/potassium-transporting ATPase subunit alpha